MATSPTNQEIEAKYLTVDKQAVIDKLEALGAIQEFKILYRRQVFDYPDRRLDKNNSWIRLRDEGNQITLTYKHRLGVTDSSAGQNDEGMEELEVIVSDFDTTANILLKTGLEVKHYAENKRTRFRLGNAEVDIDEWPLLSPYVEIEANSWQDIDEAARKLGFDPQQKVICSSNQIYKRAGITFNDYAIITFEKQIKHSEHATKPAKNITTITRAQQLVKDFAVRNNWDDSPNIDKFDHLHEELVEMSRLLRYKNHQECQQAIIDHHDALLDGMGDLLFATCRLANQLHIDLEEAFNTVAQQILNRYNGQAPESTKK